MKVNPWNVQLSSILNEKLNQTLKQQVSSSPTSGSLRPVCLQPAATQLSIVIVRTRLKILVRYKRIRIENPILAIKMIKKTSEVEMNYHSIYVIVRGIIFNLILDNLHTVLFLYLLFSLPF